MDNGQIARTRIVLPVLLGGTAALFAVLLAVSSSAQAPTPEPTPDLAGPILAACYTMTVGNIEYSCPISYPYDRLLDSDYVSRCAPCLIRSSPTPPPIALLPTAVIPTALIPTMSLTMTPVLTVTPTPTTIPTATVTPTPTATPVPSEFITVTGVFTVPLYRSDCPDAVAPGYPSCDHPVSWWLDLVFSRIQAPFSYTVQGFAPIQWIGPMGSNNERAIVYAQLFTNAFTCRATGGIAGGYIAGIGIRLSTVDGNIDRIYADARSTNVDYLFPPKVVPARDGDTYRPTDLLPGGSLLRLAIVASSQYASSHYCAPTAEVIGHVIAQGYFTLAQQMPTPTPTPTPTPVPAVFVDCCSASPRGISSPWVRVEPGPCYILIPSVSVEGISLFGLDVPGIDFPGVSLCFDEVHLSGPLAGIWGLPYTRYILLFAIAWALWKLWAR